MVFLIVILMFCREQTGEESRLLEVGGSDDVGVYGYIDGFEEMKQQVCMYTDISASALIGI